MSALEVWLPVVGFEGLYEVSNLGRVRRDASAEGRTNGAPGQTLAPVITTGGYYVVSLSRNGQVENARLHRVVLIAFCGPPPFDGAHAAHNDGNRGHNALTNLRWATPVENQADVTRHGRRCRGEAVHNAVLTEREVRTIRQRIATGERNPPIASDFGVSVSTVHLIRHNRIWRHVA